MLVGEEGGGLVATLMLVFTTVLVNHDLHLQGRSCRTLMHGTSHIHIHSNRHCHAMNVM